MKILPDHLAILRARVAPIDTPERRAKYLAGDFPRADQVRDINMRYRWDCFYASKIKIGDGVGMSGLPLYEYMNDTHIDTALRSFIPDLKD